MFDRPPDLALSRQAIENLTVRITDRHLSAHELLRIFSGLRWMVTLKDDQYYIWSPLTNPYEHHLSSARYESDVYLGLLGRLEIEIRTHIIGTRL